MIIHKEEKHPKQRLGDLSADVPKQSSDETLKCEYCAKEYPLSSKAKAKQNFSKAARLTTFNNHKEMCQKYYKFVENACSTCKFCKKQYIHTNMIFAHLETEH